MPPYYFRDPATRADARDFSRYAAALIIGAGDPVAAQDVAAARGWERPASILRAAVAAGTTSDATWAATLVDHQRVGAGFVESLRQVGVFDAALALMTRVPLEGSVGVVTVGAVGNSQTAASWRPISRLSLSGGKLELRHATAAVAVAAELLRVGGDPALDLLERELQGAVAAVVDQVFLGELADSIAATVPSSGSTAAAVAADLGELLLELKLGARSEPRLVVSADNAARLATMTDTGGGFAFADMGPQGGRIAGVPVLVSDELGEDRILAFDCVQIAAASDVIVLDAASAATLRLADPADSSQPLTSLWQDNLTALRAQRFFGFERLRPTASAVLTGLALAGSS